MRGSAEHARVLRRASAAVVVVGTLALAALMLRPGAPDAAGAPQPGPITHHAGAFGLLVLVVLAGGIAAFRGYRNATRYEQAPTAAAERLRAATVVVLGLAAALLPLTLVGWFLAGPRGSGADLAHPLYVRPQDQFGQHRGAVQPAAPRGAVRTAAPPHTWVDGAGFAIAVVVALALLVLLAAVTLRHADRNRSKPGSDPASPPPQAEAALAAAVDSGRAALHGTDARAAVIRCYAAMEASLAESGVDRLPSDSPSDLLRRAADKGVLRGEAAGALTALFREARYSTHPMDDGHLRSAAEALDAIAVQLAATATSEQSAAEQAVPGEAPR